MSTITVCVPAYRSAAFIGDTVRSVLAQTHGDFQLVVAIDPAGDGAADGTFGALEPFRGDPRVRIRVNPVRLGWAGNIASLLEAVRTEYYVILPHDDLWVPLYLEVLLRTVSEDRGAAVSYADLLYFRGDSMGERFGVSLPAGEGRDRHLLRFFLQGAHAMPWRGVTRSSVRAITGGFPTDRYLGFAVECEYALGLLEAGAARHVPLALYRKRMFGDERVSASRERIVAVPLAQRWQAWRRHRAAMHARMERMLSFLRVEDSLAVLCRCACAAAMLARRRVMVEPGLTAAEQAQLSTDRSACCRNPHPLAGATEAWLRQVQEALNGST